MHTIYGFLQYLVPGGRLTSICQRVRHHPSAVCRHQFVDQGLIVRCCDRPYQKRLWGRAVRWLRPYWSRYCEPFHHGLQSWWSGWFEKPTDEMVKDVQLRPALRNVHIDIDDGLWDEAQVRYWKIKMFENILQKDEGDWLSGGYVLFGVFHTHEFKERVEQRDRS